MSTWDKLELAKILLRYREVGDLYAAVESFVEMRECCNPTDARNLLGEAADALGNVNADLAARIETFLRGKDKLPEPTSGEVS